MFKPRPALPSEDKDNYKYNNRKNGTGKGKLIIIDYFDSCQKFESRTSMEM